MSEPALKTPEPVLPQGADLIAEFGRLKAIEREYGVTIKVVACLAEILGKVTNSKRVEITDKMIVDSPSLTAWRDEQLCSVIIETSR